MANVTGWTGNDTLNGTAQADSVSGFGGNDSVTAAGGADSIWGGAGNDTLNGGDGNDILRGDAEQAGIWGYRVYNRDFTSAAGQAFTIESGTLAGSGLASTFDVLTHVNSARGTSGDPNDFGVIYTSTFTATTAGTYTFRTTSDDGSAMRILSSDGTPLTWSGQSTGQTGLTYLNNDFHQGATTRQASVTLAAGQTYTIEIRVWENLGAQVLSADVQLPGSTTWTSLANNTNQIGTGVHSGNDVIDGGTGDDTIYGENGNDSLLGNTGRDSLFGGAGSDTLDGGAENDTLHGEDGNDSLLGNLGDDQLFGGLGDDTIYFGPGNDTVYGGDGNDLIDDLAGSVETGANLIDAGAGADTVWAGLGNDTVLGGVGADQISGEGGDDSLSGEADADVLSGDAGNDQLFGGDGADQLNGGDDDDTLTGGTGADTMTGGAGRDTFLVGADGNGDVIDGSETGVDYDVLDLRSLGRANTNVIYGGGNDESGTVEILNGLGQVIGSFTFSNIEKVLPCFTPGTQITTPDGPVAVERLRVGDGVVTQDHGAQRLVWVGKVHVSRAELIRAPHLCPVRIARGALGDGLPERDMWVSPQHRMQLSGLRAELLFGEAEVLVAALHLVGRPGITRDLPEKGVTYLHIMCEQHEIIRADGCWTESFQPGDQVLRGMDAPQRRELLDLFPALTRNKGFVAARRSLRAHEARVLLAA